MIKRRKSANVREDIRGRQNLMCPPGFVQEEKPLVCNDVPPGHGTTCQGTKLREEEACFLPCNKPSKSHYATAKESTNVTSFSSFQLEISIYWAKEGKDHDASY